MKKRIWELDAFRGLCVIGMVIVHLVYDLVDLYRIVDWSYPDWFAFVKDWGGLLFLVLSGICVTLGSRSIRRGLIVLGAAIFTFGFCDQFANLVKHAVGRIRPLHDSFMVSNGLNILETGGGLSFFSAHAANALGLATCTFVAMKRILLPSSPCEQKKSTCQCMPLWLKAYGVWMFFWAPMVAVSRVFVGKHYMGDILVGSLVGVLAGYLMAFAAIKICKRL